MTDIQKLILTTSLDFVTEREIPGNQGWEDKKFEDLMKKTGWKMGEAWCAYFVEAVLLTAGLDDHAKIISAGAVQTFKNCKVSPLFRILSSPEVGCIVVWQNYKEGVRDWTGHAGICVVFDQGYLGCVEGNSNSGGSREGVEVALKIRNPNVTPINGLRLLGCIKIIV